MLIIVTPDLISSVLFVCTEDDYITDTFCFRLNNNHFIYFISLCDTKDEVV